VGMELDEIEELASKIEESVAKMKVALGMP
jgi:hypothetical protein